MKVVYLAAIPLCAALIACGGSTTTASEPEVPSGVDEPMDEAMPMDEDVAEEQAETAEEAADAQEEAADEAEGEY